MKAMTIFKDDFLGENPDWKAACLFWRNDLAVRVTKPVSFRLTEVVSPSGKSWSRTYYGEEHAWQLALGTIRDQLFLARSLQEHAERRRQ